MEATRLGERLKNLSRSHLVTPSHQGGGDSTACQTQGNAPNPAVKTFRKSQMGMALIEFAIVATLLFAVLFTIVDFALYGYVKLTMQHAVREGARYAITGRSDLDPNPDPDGITNREAAVLRKISDSSDGLLEKVIDINNIRVEDSNGHTVSGFGNPGDTVAIHIDCEWPSFSPIVYPLLDKGKYQFTVSTAMKNEAF